MANEVMTNGVNGGDIDQFNNEDNSMSSQDGDELNLKSASAEDRIKRKAKRPSAKVNMIAAAVSGSNHVATNGLLLSQGSPKEGDGSNGLINGVIRPPRKFTKNSRRSRGRYGRGLPKKGGAGGKGTWGRLGSELVGVEEGLEDPHDPNYDSESEENCKLDVITPPLEEDEIETYVAPIIHEYYEHGDTEEVAISLEELNLGENFHQILVIIISVAMERKASHREMSSVLISDLYGRLLLEEDYERGFDVLLQSLPDLILDTPTAPTVLGNFIARAVADDCIPPKFVQSYVPGDEHTRTAIEHASALLNMKHGLVKLDSVWGVSGGMRPVKYLIRKIQLLLREYLSSQDIAEATRCLQELEVPHFHHELVYEAIVMAIEDMSAPVIDLICSLLKSLTDAVVVTIDQLRNGFTRVFDEMPDICIDVPLAYQVLEKFVQKSTSMGFLPGDILKNLPTRGRKRFVSEGDGGQLKV